MPDEPLTESVNKFSLTCPHVFMVDSYDYVGMDIDLHVDLGDQVADAAHEQELPVDEHEASDVEGIFTADDHSQVANGPTLSPVSYDHLSFSDFEGEFADDVFVVGGQLEDGDAWN